MTTVVKIGVDGFPIDPLHIYYEQHLAIDLIIEEALKKSNRCHVRVDEYLPTQSLLKQNDKFQLKTIFALFERLDWLEREVVPLFGKIYYSEEYAITSLAKNTAATSQLINKIIIKDLARNESDLIAIFHWCVVDYVRQVQSLNGWGVNLPKIKILRQVEKYAKSHQLSKDFKSLIYKSYTFWEVSGGRIIDRIILPQSEEITLRTLLDFDVADSWANEIVEQIDLLEESKKEAWIKLLSHASIATQATPTAKWLITARSLLDKVGIANFKGYVSGWFIRVERLPIAYRNRSIADRNPLILTGLVWFYSLLGDEIEVETIADLTVKCYHKIPNIGSVCLKAGNAGLWLLGEIGTFQAID